MPFCPKCRDEFQDWVKVCLDCKVTLVNELPTEPEIKKPSKDSLVQIATAKDDIVAKMWAGILEEHNIHCLLNTGSSGAAAYGQLFNVPVYIFVLDSEVKRAKQILAPYIEKKKIN